VDTEPRAFGHIVNIAEEAAKEEIERLRRESGSDASCQFSSYIAMIY
jgi:hypothetical protein